MLHINIEMVEHAFRFFSLSQIFWVVKRKGAMTGKGKIAH